MAALIPQHAPRTASPTPADGIVLLGRRHSVSLALLQYLCLDFLSFELLARNMGLRGALRERSWQRLGVPIFRFSGAGEQVPSAPDGFIEPSETHSWPSWSVAPVHSLCGSMVPGLVAESPVIPIFFFDFAEEFFSSKSAFENGLALDATWKPRYIVSNHGQPSPANSGVESTGPKSNSLRISPGYRQRRRQISAHAGQQHTT